MPHVHREEARRYARRRSGRRPALHRAGLLEPAVNPWTGYRTYRGNDALLLGSDRSLRSLEFSLSEIQAFNAAPISGQIAQLEAREARLAAEIEALKLKADRLAKVKSFLEKARLCSGFVDRAKPFPDRSKASSRRVFPPTALTSRKFPAAAASIRSESVTVEVKRTTTKNR